ncbi:MULTISPECIES: helix-turn-helix domain-containing protein [unclassified Myroides]|uniref:winged helix-turn-helix transcriptional regulator n=1 Tax=unclassified Myroides TaxID=2642485 RepID=UPI0015FE63DB|nr:MULTISPECIES: helix-turn-helix domain-containing protein [unclassified Myroides]MBB1149846.1 helix-turn-helix transcriptional regulator [Myroides sp. NP-2]MDM1408488.1 helix-turn-helix transcriptional regulator [Myroides sp. DF42-4-2]
MSTLIHLENIQHTLNSINGKWRIPLLTVLFQQDRARYSTLQQQLPKIGSKMLTSELKALEQLHLIERIITETPVLIEYKLSEKGRSLLPVLEALAQWGERERPRKAAKLTQQNKHEINHFLTISI